jgi:FMN-dependent NADH-azoreductase
MTRTILHIDASARHDQSKSRAMSQRIVDHLGAETVIHRDLADSLPHIDGTWVGATFTPPAERTAEQNEKLALSDGLLAELLAADAIVIGTPVYNFNIPASLKAWIDQIGRVGVAFRYTETGPVGMLASKPVYIAVASGGTKLGSQIDFVSNYLKFVFGFVGLSDVQLIQVADDETQNDANLRQIGALNEPTSVAA